ncbi:MAG: extracellular solute-binding protein [Treponema sp.]|jgi:putative spermidine/putrescine transport system substrate-binding protein|nr:extracellular solute-binding protein [Treponema sp.]
MKTRSFKRNTLVLLSLTLTALIAVSCGGAKKETQIVVATYAGKYQELLNKYVIPELKKTHPNLKVVYTLGNDGDHNPKLIAEKGGQGSFDVLTMSASSLTTHYENEIIGDLDFAKLPNAAHLLEQFKFNFAVPQIYSAVTLAYNEKEVSPKPDSWAVFWEPKYKGKVGVFSGGDAYWMLAAVAANGGDILKDDWLNHWPKLMELRNQDPKFYASQDALVTALRSGEVWLSINYRARNALLTAEGSEPLADVLPREGSYATWYGAAIPKNANNPEGAYAFLNTLLLPEVQKGFGEDFGYSPSVDNVTLSPEILGKIGFNTGEQRLVYPIPTPFFQELSTRMNEPWNQEFMR